MKTANAIRSSIPAIEPMTMKKNSAERISSAHQKQVQDYFQLILTDLRPQTRKSDEEWKANATGKSLDRQINYDKGLEATIES